MSTAGTMANAIAGRNVFAAHEQPQAPNTRNAHEADLRTFAQYLVAAQIDAPAPELLVTNPESWQGVSWGLVEGFKQWMLQNGFTLASINRKLSTVKVFARLASQAGVIHPDELTLIQTVRSIASKSAAHIDATRQAKGQATRTGSKKTTSTTLTPAQAKALKSQPDTPQGRRDAVLMALLLDHGLRVGELAALDVNAVNLDAGDLVFYRPKVAKVQRHKLTRDSAKALRAYIDADAPDAGPLLRASIKGGALAGAGMVERSITVRVGELGSRLGIESLSAHDCRHYWATRAIRRGDDPFALLQAGGWSSMATVQRYVDETVIANAGIGED